MKDWGDADYFLAILALLCVTGLTACLIVRLTNDGPDRTVECVKAGGSWNDRAAGHCERGSK